MNEGEKWDSYLTNTSEKFLMNPSKSWLINLRKS